MENTKNKYFLYARKSTDTEDKQVASIESQIEELQKIAKREGLEIVQILSESKSAKQPGRVIFDEMINKIKKGDAQGILCWKLDRLARNPVDGGLINWLLQQSIIKHIRTYEKSYSPTDNVLLMSVEFGVANQYIKDLSVNVKRGLRKKVSDGWMPNKVPAGYKNIYNEQLGYKMIIKDNERFFIVRKIWDLMLTGNYTPPQILKIVNEEWNYKTLKRKREGGKPMSRSAIYRILTNPFYYGQFEFPLGSGNWVRGKHEPMITESEFQSVQTLLGKDGRPAPHKHIFAFTGLMKCGFCGSSVTAEIKVKKQKNGNIHNYVYYHCTKKKDASCTEKSIEVKELTSQIDGILAKITIPEEFKNWAIKHLHQIRKEDATNHQTILGNKQKELNLLNEQLSSLLIKYTSTSNLNGVLISDEEYKLLKSTLLNKKMHLESELSNSSKKFDEWIELSEKTFNFARYARIWFEKGDTQTKREIVSCLGSNLIIKDKKLLINIHSMFKKISDSSDLIKEEFSNVRTYENLGNKRKTPAFTDVHPSLLPDRDSNPN